MSKARVRSPCNNGNHFYSNIIVGSEDIVTEEGA